MRSTPRPAPPSAAPSSTTCIARIQRALRQRSAVRSGARTHRDGREAFRARSRNFPRLGRSGGRAFSASRDGSAVGRPARRPTIASIAAEIRGEIEIPLDRRRVQAARRRRPHRARCRRPLCHPRLQDRRVADRKAGAHRARAAAHARSRDAAPRRLQDAFRPAARWPRWPMCCSRAARRRRVQADRFQGGHAGRARPIGPWQSSPALVRRFDDETSLIARWSIRCGRRATAITTISRASRNGRRPAVPKTTIPASGAPNEIAEHHSARRAAAAGRSVRSRRFRPGSPPMPARARPTCWRSA